MIRTLTALLAIVAVGLPAHAWKNYSSTDRFDTECRTPNNGVGCIIEAEQVYVRPSTEGAAPKKLSLVKQFILGEETLIPILERQGTTGPAYEKFAQDHLGFGKNNYLYYIANQTVLTGIADDQGNILLPAEYRWAYPVSDKLAYVQRLDLQYGYVTLDGTASFTPTSFYWSHINQAYGKTPDQPLVVRFEGPTNSDGLKSYLFPGPTGEIDLTIDRVVERREPDQGNDYYVFNNNLYAFPVRAEDGSEFSVYIDPFKLEIDHLGPQLTIMAIGHSLDNKPPNQWIRLSPKSYDELNRIAFGSGTDFVSMPLEKRGTLASGHGLFNGDIYVPLSLKDGTPVEMKDGAVGMVPLYVKDHMDFSVTGVRGWLVVYGEGSERYYRFITHVVGGPEFMEPLSGNVHELAPINVNLYAVNALKLADVWVGSMDEEVYRDMFRGQNPDDIPSMPLHAAVRFFEDPDLGAAGGISDWYTLGTSGEDAYVRQTAEHRNPQFYKSSPDDPQTLVTEEIIKQARALFEEKYDSRMGREYPEEWAAVRAERLAKSQREKADEILANGYEIEFHDVFYTVARTQGGKYLQAYWNRYKQLPNEADASDICSRFGNNSRECGTVWRWAQARYEGRAQAERVAAEEYARKAYRDPIFDWKPDYRPPPNYQGRCYNQGDGTEKCFYD